jgi:outer membrane protein assembly factor BamE (lipoprotein component of BamABCDE complex)
MSSVRRRMIIGVAIVGAMAATTGCSRIRAHQGYLIDPQLVATVQPGIDNKESVQRTLGRPSFAGQFTDSDWYYVSRDTRQLAFGKPRPIEQTVLHVTFDPAGNVAAVKQIGLEQVASINPVKDTTPTLGRKSGFFEDLFGNIGRVGAIGGGGQPSDNTGG